MSPKKLINWIRILTPATAIASFLLGSLLMVLVGLNLAYAQIANNGDDDLNQAAVPEYDFDNNVDKSMVVLLNFTALNKAEFVAVGVSYGPPHSNIGNPPLLRVQIYDYNGSIIQQFNYWHPLFALEFQEDGKEYLKILPNAVGRFVFPFDPNAALMKVSYLYHEGANNTRAEEVISVDLRPTIPSFCKQFPHDPHCKSSDLAVVDVNTANGQQQLPILVGNSTDVTVETTVTNNGPDKPIDATLSSRSITTPPGSDGGVIVTPAAGATPNENGAVTTTIVTSLSERQQHDQTYTVECWEPGKYNIIFESEVAFLSGVVVDDNQLNNKGQMTLEVDCGYIDVCPPPPEPLGVSIEANATEDGSPPTTIEFRAITEGGTQPHKFGWNFDDDSSNNSNNNNIKGDQLMTHQFTKLAQYNVTVTVTDSANGSRCQTASDNIIVAISDKEAPRVIVPSKIIVEATGPEGANNVTFTVSATDNVDGPVPVECDKKKEGDTFSLRPPLTTVNCQATDSSGNTGYGSFPVTVQDTTPPEIKVIHNGRDIENGGNIIAEATGPDGAVVNFTVSATDKVDGPVPVSCQVQSRGQVQSGDTFPIGETVVTCSAEDAAGNRAEESFTVTVQDTTPPVITVSPSPPIIAEATGPEGAVVNFTVSATDKVDGTATLEEDGTTITQDQVGRDIEISCTHTSRSIFPLSETTVECQATDSYDNRVDGSFSVTVQDTTPPVITVSPSPPIIAEATGPEGAVVNFTVSATDKVDGTATLEEDGVLIQGDQDGRDIQISCNPRSGSTFRIETTTVNCEATDSSGNTANGNFTVTVQDTTPPKPELPINLPPVEATGPDGAIVTFPPIPATDIVDGKATLGKNGVLIQGDQDGRDIQISCNPRSGSTFRIETTTVNCEATDSSGNTANGNFTVTVQDTTPPKPELPINLPPVEATGPDGAIVTFPPIPATDIVDGKATLGKNGVLIQEDQDGRDIRIWCDLGSGNTFGLNITTVNCEATDKSNNTAKGNFTVTVQDTTAPEIIVWYNDGETERKVEDGDTITVEATGPNGTSEKSIFDSLEYYATDIVDGSVGVSCSSPSGFTFSVGDTDVSCSAFDAAQNTGTKSFTIVVTYTPPLPPCSVENQDRYPIEGCVPDPNNCSDGSDNDGDGLIDSSDSDCAIILFTPPRTCPAGTEPDPGNTGECVPIIVPPLECPPGTGPDEDDRTCVPIPGAEEMVDEEEEEEEEMVDEEEEEEMVDEEEEEEEEEMVDEEEV